MILHITDREQGDELIQGIPFDKYPFAGPKWMMKDAFFHGRLAMCAYFNEKAQEIQGVVLFRIEDRLCHVALIHGPNVFDQGFKEFKDFLGDRVDAFRFWTCYPKTWRRFVGAKELYTMMEVKKEG